MSEFLAVGYDFAPFPGFPIKVQGKGGQSTTGVWNKATSKERTFKVRRDIPGVSFREIILLDTVLC